MAALTKEVALITGGNTGLGFECGKKLLREHGGRVHVVIGSRTLAKGEDVIRALKADGHQGVESVQLDVTSEDSVAQAAATIAERHEKVDVLLVNRVRAQAGIAPDIDYPDRSAMSLGDLIMLATKTNVAGAAATVEHFVPLSKADNPRVVFMSTGASSMLITHDRVGLTQDFPAYSVSKAGLNMLMFCYYHRFPQWKINACSPGFRATKLNHFGHNPYGQVPGPLEEGPVNAVRLMLLGKDGESGTHTQFKGEADYETVPW
ncbi:Short-chain dehydrogenase/reductase ATR10 [Apiospora phragmitis]|uniref:Short-chain dehydrogenase/reductase ATR10 n=1 Tax=Apiospora phragmitis TaxID=2905665 RepID=A0ABR1UL53_9PEZI